MRLFFRWRVEKWKNKCNRRTNEKQKYLCVLSSFYSEFTIKEAQVRISKVQFDLGFVQLIFMINLKQVYCLPIAATDVRVIY